MSPVIVVMNLGSLRLGFQNFCSEACALSSWLQSCCTSSAADVFPSTVHQPRHETTWFQSLLDLFRGLWPGTACPGGSPHLASGSRRGLACESDADIPAPEDYVVAVAAQRTHTQRSIKRVWRDLPSRHSGWWSREEGHNLRESKGTDIVI